MTVFADRRNAGARLALQLQGYAERPDVVVVPLARGGIPVGYEIAVRLGLRLAAFDAQRIDELATHHTLIVAVDGVEAAAEMIPALAELRRGRPDHIVAAIPVACADACAALAPHLDDLVCLVRSSRNVERAYRDFSKTSDAGVRKLLDDAARQWRGRSIRGGMRAAS